jgi:hypothetical protein
MVKLIGKLKKFMISFGDFEWPSKKSKKNYELQLFRRYFSKFKMNIH